MWIIIYIIESHLFDDCLFCVRRCVRAREMQGAEGEDEGVYSRK